MTKLIIREIAESQGYNLNRLQRETGLTMGMMRRYWYNDTVSVRLDALSAISKVLGVSSGDLLADTTDAD